MSTKKFDSSIPRRMYFSTDLPNSRRCPRCDSKLKKEYQTYMVAVRDKGEFETLITGNDGGSFCPQCPVVVLDYEVFGKIASVGRDRGARAMELAVIGIVNLDAVPEEKRNLVLGGDDNPIPLVQFIHDSDEERSDQSVSRSPEKRIGRNDPCPCGSGKKYKKCCGQ
jgi:hypothetical protein